MSFSHTVPTLSGLRAGTLLGSDLPLPHTTVVQGVAVQGNKHAALPAEQRLVAQLSTAPVLPQLQPADPTGAIEGVSFQDAEMGRGHELHAVHPRLHQSWGAQGGWLQLGLRAALFPSLSLFPFLLCTLRAVGAAHLQLGLYERCHSHGCIPSPAPAPTSPRATSPAMPHALTPPHSTHSSCRGRCWKVFQDRLVNALKERFL